MPRSPPRPRPPPRPRTPPPVPAPSQPMVAPAAGGGGGDEQEQEQEFEICNDEGFVYKVPTGLYPDAAPSSTQAAAAGPDPVTAGLRRRRRALLRLRAKRLRHLSRWEALASEHLAPLLAPRPPVSQAPPESPHPVADTASAASASVLDDLIAQADVQAELLKRASQLYDDINALCDAQEAAIVDDIARLPIWGNPRELVAQLCSRDEQTHPGTSGMDERNGGFQSLDGQQRVIGVASEAVESAKNSGDKWIQSPSQCKRCFQSFCTGKTCRGETQLGDELPLPVLTENSKRKGRLVLQGPIVLLHKPQTN